MALNSGGPISLIGSITGQSIAKQLNISETAQLDLFNSSVRTLLQQASGPVSMFNAYGQPRANSDMYILWPSNLSGGNFNTLGTSRVIQNGHYLTNGGTVTTTWTMKAFPQIAYYTQIIMYFNGYPVTRNVDGSITLGTSYYWGAYNPNAYTDNRTYCSIQSNLPQNTDAQVSGMAYYALNGGAGGGRTVFTNGPSGFTVAASISGNVVTCTITNNTGQDQFLYAYPHNGGSTRQILYWGWYYATPSPTVNLFDYSFNRGTWNNQSSDTYGVPLFSYVQVVLNGIPYNIYKAHQSGATQANVISDIKTQLENALSGLESAAVTNVANGLKVATIGIPTINYTYKFPEDATGATFANGTDPSYYGSTNFTPTVTNVAPEFSFTISSNQQEANLRTLALAAGWDGTIPVNATVGAGVYVWSDNTSVAGLTIDGSWPGGVTLTNNGYIIGKGGQGGSNGGTTAGAPGGPAISLGINATIVNNSGAFIAGGGGGGGGNLAGGGGGAGGGNGGAGRFLSTTAGGSIGSSGSTGGQTSSAAPGGSGGGAGGGAGATAGFGPPPNPPAQGGSGGGGGRILPGTGGSGAVGLNSTGGTGGSGNGAGSVASPSNGNGSGGGGGWGASGGTASNGSIAGGAGGKAIALNGNAATTSGSGTIYGAIS
jgi:hypothetical protein